MCSKKVRPYEFAEMAAILFVQMGFYYREGMPLVGGIMQLFKELQLEDLRRV
jgi:hypothetical protein